MTKSLLGWTNRDIHRLKFIYWLWSRWLFCRMNISYQQERLLTLWSKQRHLCPVKFPGVSNSIQGLNVWKDQIEAPRLSFGQIRSVDVFWWPTNKSSIQQTLWEYLTPFVVRRCKTHYIGVGPIGPHGIGSKKPFVVRKGSFCWGPCYWSLHVHHVATIKNLGAIPV